MSIYLEFAKQAFRQRFIYRLNAYMMIVSSFLGLLILISVWKALYAGKTEVNGITYENMLQFLVLNMAIQSLIRSRIGQKIGERVENGAISLDLIRPITLKGYFLADQIGENVFGFLFSTLPAAAAAALLWGFAVPGEPFRFPLFVISLLLGIALMNQINYLFGLLAIWLKTAFFINFITGAVISLFAGSFVPLWFYPEPLYKISLLLPFHLVSFQPIAIYLGKKTLTEAGLIIGGQLVWMLLLLGLEKWMWRRAQTHIDVFGG
ncbi:ABC-2 family transporter protein [Paenibacillus aurantius]|uniref:ABC-2 family transporter protein n=1 Tax=Paenibacillus aurantius TaxID=2918900 RepID=A0AA96LCG7_9BACL|nr:ABC-2 family transporter protein [Paenibacillus aurantius]WNQ10628.1 ABC-2 family transporter protein [Paenibacillus aurantius]